MGGVLLLSWLSAPTTSLVNDTMDREHETKTLGGWASSQDRKQLEANGFPSVPEHPACNVRTVLDICNQKRPTTVAQEQEKERLASRANPEFAGRKTRKELFCVSIAVCHGQAWLWCDSHKHPFGGEHKRMANILASSKLSWICFWLPRASAVAL